MTDVDIENGIRFSLFIRHMPSASVTKGLNAALVLVPLMSLEEALLDLLPIQGIKVQGA
jgi:hypothetical protein